MALRINSEAPNFTADSTQGRINFHEWIGNGWAILFSHPKNFTPVCTTELGYMAGLKPEFDKRNCKIIGLSVDSVPDHEKWSKDIEETQGHAVTYPLVGDPELKVAKAYDMLPEDSGTTAQGRTAADNATVRSVFVVGDGEAQGGHARELEAGGGRHHRAGSFGCRRQAGVPRWLEGTEALHPDRSPAPIGNTRSPAAAVSLPPVSGSPPASGRSSPSEA